MCKLSISVHIQTIIKTVDFVEIVHFGRAADFSKNCQQYHHD